MDANEKKLAAEARNAYARKWRAANPDKVRANNANYWLRRAAKEAARKEAEEAGKDGTIPKSLVRSAFIIRRNGSASRAILQRGSERSLQNGCAQAGINSRQRIWKRCPSGAAVGTMRLRRAFTGI